MDKTKMLEALIEHYTKGNKAQFAKLLGVSAQTISAWIARSTFDAYLIYAKCRYVNSEWLLTGEGEMLKSKRTMGDNHTTVQPTSCNKDTQNNPDTQDLIRYLNNTIRQQAEEIGCLKERIRQMTIEKEKHVPSANTHDTANAI